MSRVLMVALVCLPSALCVGAAAHLASSGIDGWGWFLFAACCLGGSASFGEKS